MIKNIIFDMSEVIISGYHGVENLLEREYGIPKQEFEKQRLAKNEIFLELMRGHLKEEEYWNEVLRGMNWDITVEELKTTIRRNLNRPIPGTMEIIKKLKGEYQLILLSDYVREWMEYIEYRNEQLRIFDQKVFSYNIGSVKSELQTFRTLLNQTKIIADQTLFIDDYEQNVRKAEEVGIHGIVFKDAKQLKQDLCLKYNLILKEKEDKGKEKDL